MTIICKKGAQDFHRALSKVFDGVKSVALWSANIRKNCPRTIRATVPQLIHYILLFYCFDFFFGITESGRENLYGSALQFPAFDFLDIYVVD